MLLIDEILSNISQNPSSKAAHILGMALASSCSSDYFVSLLDVADSLDANQKQWVKRLVSITHEPDFDNDDQHNALCALSAMHIITLK